MWNCGTDCVDGLNQEATRAMPKEKKMSFK